MQSRKEIVEAIVPPGRGAVAERAGRFAPANIALCKYWGKRDEELNLPVTGSLSISLGELGTTTSLSLREGADRYRLNGREMEEDGAFALRLRGFLDLFRGADAGLHFEVEARNTIPTAAGYASSASGFAAVVLALDELFGWGLGVEGLSILARLGSGSACRSIQPGFVEWARGERADGMDSYATALPDTWPELRIGLLAVADAPKPIGSREAMKRTVETAALYHAWPDQVRADLPALRRAIGERDFATLGARAEANALSMHATMIATWPPVLYWLPESVAAMRRVWALREEGAAVYFTMDAGPNLKLLFEADTQDALLEAFPGLRVTVPFPA